MKFKLVDSPVIIIKHCKYCKENVEALMAKSIKADGSIGLFWQCRECDHQLDDKYSNGIWIEHKLAEIKLGKMGISIEDIPIARYSCGERCARCGNRGTQRHHWAPQVLFKDADDWPTDYLCKSCHELWHQIVDVKSLKTINSKTQ